jgi:hypothetical protein
MAVVAAAASVETRRSDSWVSATTRCLLLVDNVASFA